MGAASVAGWNDCGSANARACCRWRHDNSRHACWELAGAARSRHLGIKKARNQQALCRSEYGDHTRDNRAAAAADVPDGKHFKFVGWPAYELLLPQRSEPTIERREEGRCLRFPVQGVPVSVTVEGIIELMIQGDLPDEVAGRIVEEVRANAEYVFQHPCTWEQVSP